MTSRTLIQDSPITSYDNPLSDEQRLSEMEEYFGPYKCAINNCNINSIIRFVYKLFFQLVCVFTFLTTFYFLYVVSVEKRDFEEQISFLVEKLFTPEIINSMLSQIKDPNTGEFLIDKDQLAIVLSGIIDATSKKLELDLTTQIENYEKNNKNVKSMAFKYVRYALIALISISILLLFIGNCYRNMVGEMFMETLSVIMVVAVTELLFLETIGARYISADPNRVKRKLASSIIDYINNRDDSISIPGGLNCNLTDVSNNLSNQLNDLNNQIQNELGPVNPENIDDVINTKTQSIKQSLEDNLSTQFSDLRTQIKQELGDIDEDKINQLIQSKSDLVNQTINECLPSNNSQRKLFNV